MLRQAIESALPTVATVICAMIYEYGRQFPHQWTIEPVKWLPSGCDKDEAVGPIRLKQTGNRSQVDWIADRFADMYKRWYLIVSDVDLERGDWTWTVELVADINLISWYYIGVGVTAKSCSTVDLFSNSNPEPTCVVAKISFDGWIVVGADAERPLPDRIRIDDLTKTRCRFVADPIRRRITMRYGIADSNNIAETVLFTAATDVEFAALRPCVLLRDRSTAIIAS